MDQLLTTSQFANLCRVEKRTLFYYDEIDLLKPVLVTENKYRYYSPEQFDTMSMIKALQSVDMSLNEIKALMSEQDITHSVDMLKEQIHRIKEKQEELRQTEQFLSHTVDELERCHRIGCDVFYTEKLREAFLRTEAVANHKSNLFINYLTNGYHHGVIIEDMSKVKPKSVFKRVQKRSEANEIRPAGTYACIYQSIPNGEVNRTIHKFIDLLKTKQCITEGPLYMEDFTNDFICFPNQELLFKFSIKLAAI